MTDYLHGIEVLYRDQGAAPVAAPGASVIGVVGTAYRGPANEPVLVRSRAAAAQAFATGDDDGVSLPTALAGIYDHGDFPVVAVNVLDPAKHKQDVNSEDVQLAAGAGRLAKRRVTKAVVKSGDDTTTYTEGTHYSLDREAGTIAVIDGAAGAPAGNAALHVTYSWLDASAVAAADAIGGAQPDGYTGAFALLDAEGSLSLRPRILCAPGWTREAATANAILPVADRLRGTLVIDGPSTTDAAAVALRRAIASERAYVVDPKLRTAAGEEWQSPRVAGVIAASDRDVGWWRSPSNRPIRGIAGTARPIDWAIDDKASRANILNADEVATVIQRGGYRLWGNRTCSADPRWVFLNVARIRDQIDEALIDNHLWAIDRNVSGDYFRAVSENVNAFLRSLVPLGAILGGSCRPSGAALNSAQAVQGGRSYFDVEFTPAVPAERITFRVAITNERYEEVAQT